MQTNLIYFIPSLFSSISVSLLSLDIPSLSLTYPSHDGGFSSVGHGFGVGLVAEWSGGGVAWC